MVYCAWVVGLVVLLVSCLLLSCLELMRSIVSGWFGCLVVLLVVWMLCVVF